MSLIDNNGKLLGRINIIDFLVLIVGIMLIVAIPLYIIKDIHKKEAVKIEANIQKELNKDMINVNLSVLIGYDHYIGIINGTEINYTIERFIVKEVKINKSEYLEYYGDE